jgi:hypothetical protein
MNIELTIHSKKIEENREVLDAGSVLADRRVDADDRMPASSPEVA